MWNIERIVTNIFIPILNSSAIGGPTVSEDLRKKVKNELLPCLRSFTRCENYLLDCFETVHQLVEGGRDGVDGRRLFERLPSRGVYHQVP